MLEEYVWTSFIRKSEVENLSQEEIKEMVSELSLAVQSVCFAHGIHN
jgi:hypothetical protein